jgi:hypothetical protein
MSDEGSECTYIRSTAKAKKIFATTALEHGH